MFVDQNGENIARTYVPNPNQPKNAAQRAVTGRFTQVAGFWNALSTSQKLAWATAAQGRKGSGWNMYQSLSNVWLNAHNGVGTPPVNPPSGELATPGISVTASASGSVVTFHGSASTSALYTIQFELQALKNAARKPAKEAYKVAGFAGFDAGDGNEASFSVAPGAYAARYAFVEVASGRRTAFVTIPVSGLALGLEQGGAAEKPASRRKAA